MSLEPACETARALLSRALDEELDRVPRGVLSLHLETCAECAGFATEAVATTHLLREAPLTPFRLEPARPLRRSTRGLTASAAAAAAAVAIGLAALAGGATGPSTGGTLPGRDAAAPVKLPIGQRMAESDFAA